MMLLSRETRRRDGTCGLGSHVMQSKLADVIHCCASDSILNLISMRCAISCTFEKTNGNVKNGEHAKRWRHYVAHR